MENFSFTRVTIESQLVEHCGLVYTTDIRGYEGSTRYKCTIDDTITGSIHRVYLAPPGKKYTYTTNVTLAAM